MLHEANLSSPEQLATIALNTIKVRFPVAGRTLPTNHGYALYACLSRLFPHLHQAEWLGIEQISGVSFKQGIISLPTRNAALYLRLPAERYGEVLPLAGQRLDVDNHCVTLGIPSARPLLPAPSLYARFVTIKKFTEPDSFLEAAQRHITQLGVTARLELPVDDEGRARRRVLRIKQTNIVGFSLAAHDLSDADSLTLQAHGLGGRRAMGGGIFNAISGRNT